jgi:hypothetical protein
VRNHLATLVALLVIAACVLILFFRIETAYRGPVLPASWTPPPLVPSATASPTAASTTAAAPASTAPPSLGSGSPLPTRTVTTWTTVTARPASTGEDGA